MRVLHVFSDAGELYFDRSDAVLSRIDVIPPKVERQILQRNAFSSQRQLEPRVGTGSIVLEGHLLPTEGGRESELKRTLSRIAYPGGRVTLETEGLTRVAEVSSLRFDADAPFSSGVCEHFTLTLISDDPFFDGAEETFVGKSDVTGGVAFPVSVPEEGMALGSLRSTGGVVIRNRGDAVRGFVAELYFPKDTVAFTLHSDREEGAFAFTRPIAAGTRLILDTRTGRKSIANGNGESLLPYLDKRCVFFSALPGNTRLSWRSIEGASPEVSVRFVPGYQNL